MITLSAPALGDGLRVYGENWAFAVSEPAGWHGDTETGARQYHVNIAFFPAAADSKEADVTIRVRVGKKSDENIAEDLKADMDGYRKEYAKVEFGDLKVHHARYALVAKVFFERGAFFEYVTYLNPGKEYPYILSVAMSKAKAAASAAEMAAYQNVLESIAFMRKRPA